MIFNKNMIAKKEAKNPVYTLREDKNFCILMNSLLLIYTQLYNHLL